MNLSGTLRRRRQAVEATYFARKRLHTVSLPRFRLHGFTTEALREHGQGDLLEVGAGLSPYSATLAEVADRVTTLDIEDRSGTVDLIGDVQSMPEVGDETFDTVLCTQVLEHVPDPARAVREIARVLRPGGCLIATVPHLSMIHEAPHDYFRFTEYGLTYLCQEADLVVERLVPTGGLVSFLAHTASLALLSTLGSLPLLGPLARLVNYLLLVRGMDYVDRLFGAPSHFPRDYLVVARKPNEPSGRRVTP